MAALIRSKLEPPSPLAFGVHRSASSGRLGSVLGRRLATVVAPAGYGKTTLVAEFAATVEGAATAWLSVDERDTDLVRFGEHLLACLDSIHPGVSDAVPRPLATNSLQLGDDFVDAVLHALETLERDAVLVLDDLDRITGPTIDDLGRLVLEAPTALHVVVTARADLPLPVHRLRSRGELCELRAADLRFSLEEARELVQRLGEVVVDDDQAAHLLRVTEGWPVAVQLVALSLARSADPTEITSFSGADRNIVDYLSAEILANETEDVRDFLLDTSVLDVLDGGICDALTGRTDGDAVLDDLDRRGMFVTRLDTTPERYRYHRLLREFLRHRLRTMDPDRPGRLRRRAARWARDHGDVDHAASYLVLAEAWDELADLIQDLGRELWERGRSQTLVLWLEQIPTERRLARPSLMIAESAMHAASGNPEAAAARLAELERGRTLTAGEQCAVDAFGCAEIATRAPSRALLARAGRALDALGAPDLELPDVFGTTPAELDCGELDGRPSPPPPRWRRGRGPRATVGSAPAVHDDPLPGPCPRHRRVGRCALREPQRRSEPGRGRGRARRAPRPRPPPLRGRRPRRPLGAGAGQPRPRRGDRRRDRRARPGTAVVTLAVRGPRAHRARHERTGPR